MDATLIKEYTVKELQEFAKSYKQVSVQDMSGKRICAWNANKPIETHLKECIKRVQNDITPEGYYYFCFSQAPRFNKDNFTKYLFRKGTPPQHSNPLNDNSNQMQNKNDLLSVSSALQYITQIAELKVNNQVLEMEVKRLKDENAVMSAELEEFEREEGVSEGKGSDVVEYLKETAPSLMALADRFFIHQDKKLELENRKLDNGVKTEGAEKKTTLKRTIKIFETGSPEHLSYIKLLYNQEKEDEMNKELNKLELLNPEEYQKICTELNLFEDETEQPE